MAVLCCSHVHAAPILPRIITIPAPIVTTLLGEPPVEEDFLKAIRRFEEWNKNLDNPDFYYKRVTFRNRAGKVIKFKDLSEFEKSIFYITQGNKLTNTLAKLEFLWKIESARLPDINVKKYLGELTDLRKDTAVKYEDVIEGIFKKFPKEIPEQERDLFLKEIRELHDKHNLVKRDE